MRSALPTAALWLLESRAQGAVRAGIGRLQRRRPRAELYLAFDDPYGVLAIDVVRGIGEDFAVDTEIFPVVRRGLDGELDGNMRRAYALRDAQRLGARRGHDIVRTLPIEASRVAELAYWTEAARDRGAHLRWTEAALERLWCRGKALPDYGELYALFHKTTGAPPPKDLLRLRHRVRQNEARLQRRGHWDTPSLWIEGKWFFAHERREQIRDYLAELQS